MTPRWLPIVLLGLLWAADAPTWHDRATRLTPSGQDAGSLLINNVLGTVGFAAGLSASLLLPPLLPAWIAWSGAGLAICGAALRCWAMLTLGPLFTLPVQVRPGQPLIERGPYRWIRHPSYVGADLALLGIGLSSGNWVPPILFTVPWLAAHMYRIRIEERALLTTLGEAYARYRD